MNREISPAEETMKEDYERIVEEKEKKDTWYEMMDKFYEIREEMLKRIEDKEGEKEREIFEISEELTFLLHELGEKMKNVKTGMDLYNFRSEIESLTPEDLKRKFEALMFAPEGYKEKKEK